MRFNSLHYLFRKPFSARRMRCFWRRFGLSSETRVLDVGGGLFNWSLLPTRPRLVILNTFLPEGEGDDPATRLIADGCRLPFEDKAFDVVYSNSVIEHVGDAGKQRAFARECVRVGARYYVQTPNRGFPIEPHWIVPFVHWLPRRFQGAMVRNLSVRGLMTRPSRQQCEALLDGVRLLGERELRRLFPGAEIWRERFLGLVKSLIAVENG